MRIFVTGATGYIGRVVTERALAEGHTIHGLSRDKEGDAKLRALGATPVRGDLTSLDGPCTFIQKRMHNQSLLLIPHE